MRALLSSKFAVPLAKIPGSMAEDFQRETGRPILMPGDFFDTSALAKHYHAELGSTEIDRLWHDATREIFRVAPFGLGDGVCIRWQGSSRRD